MNQFFAALTGTENFILTWDVAVALFIFFAGFLYGITAGRRKIVLFLLSMYGSVALLRVFPFFEIVTETTSASLSIVELGTLVVLVFVLYFVFIGSALKPTLPRLRKGKGPIWQTGLLSITVAGFAASIFFATIQADLSPMVSSLLTTPVAQFSWAVVPLIPILLARKGRE